MKSVIKSTLQFLDGVKCEFARVIWPSKQELMGVTLIVLFTMVFYAVYLGVVDFIIKSLAAKIF